MSAFGRLYRGESNIDFIDRRKLWFTISAVALLVSIGAIFFRPTENPCRSPLPQGLECGIEFNGGLSVSAPVAEDGPLAQVEDPVAVTSQVRSDLSAVGTEGAQVQVSESEGTRQVLVQTTRISDPEERDQLVDAVAESTGASTDETTIEAISASFGGEITGKAIRALLVFLVVILAFMAWRFEWKMGAAAIAALFHDLLITAGVYAIVGFEVTPSTVIALLTILGYSLYDTVVVFDKVEENTTALAATGRMTYGDAANQAMNQVFMRSLNTSLTTLLPVAALLVVGVGLLGASTLQDLALALFVGILSGTYSSIFVATPILTSLKESEPKYQSIRSKVEREKRRTKVESESERVPAPVGGGQQKSVARSGSSRPATTRPRDRIGTKKAKRRRKR